MPDASPDVNTTNGVGAACQTGPADPAYVSPSYALSAHDQRRNFTLGVINGALFRVGDVLIDTQMVLTWFLSQLGTSNLLIGLVSPIRFGGSFVLQMLASGYIERQPYKLPFYRMVSIFRSLSLLVFAVVAAFLPVSSAWLPWVFFAVLIFFSLGAGLVGIPFMDVVGKVIPPRRRGAFFGQRMFWGGILALGGSSLVGFLLAEPDGLQFPTNVAVLFFLSAIMLSITAWSWVVVKEPPSVVPNTHGEGIVQRVAAQFREGLGFLREDVLYRRYVLVRLALTGARWAAPFYVIYAERELGIQASMLGFYLGAQTVAGIVSNLVWGRISDTLGNRRLIVVSNALGVVTPLLAMAIGLVNRSVGGASTWLGYAFGLVFLIAGMVNSGSGMGIMNYLLDIAPEERRPLYLAFTNTVFGLAYFTGMASGLIADSAGFGVLLGISAVFSVVALVVSVTMAEPRLATSPELPASPDLSSSEAI